MPVQPDNPYLRDATAMIASQYDQRFSYCVYVPASADWSGTRKSPLVVIVHGSRRMAQQERDAYKDFAERHGATVLAPLFPIGVGSPDNTEGYKLLRYDGIEYDRILLAMIDEAAKVYPIDASRFFIHGFSGGGQFAHRFFYLHPRRCRAVSVGAPGNVTLIDDRRSWWVGTSDIDKLTGSALDLTALRTVPVHLVIGALDSDPDDVLTRRDSRHYREGINESGGNRLERMATLERSLDANGINARTTVVPGVGHNGFALVDAVKNFFDGVITAEVASPERQPA